MPKPTLDTINLDIVLSICHSTIDNKYFICDCFDRRVDGDEGYAASLLRFDELDITTKKIVFSMAVIFNQAGDTLYFLYGSDKYEVIAATSDLITLKKDGVEFFIKRIKSLDRL